MTQAQRSSEDLNWRGPTMWGGSRFKPQGSVVANDGSSISSTSLLQQLLENTKELEIERKAVSELPIGDYKKRTLTSAHRRVGKVQRIIQDPEHANKFCAVQEKASETFQLKLMP